MVAAAPVPAGLGPARALALFGLALALTLGARIAALVVTPIGLHGDEAQYWVWSRTLDWGYFSKPPLIAWAIAAATAVFGNAEWAVRLTAPLAHGLGAAALFALGSRLYGPLAGLFAGVGWLWLPGVWVSSAVISTDALLLPLWACALLAAWRLVETRSWVWAAALGATIGLGALAKYAMLYFPAGMAVAALWSAPARAAFLSWRGLGALAIAGLILAPNLAWNAANSFATLSHTAANANLGGPLFHPEKLFAFWASQPALLGPIVFGATGFGVWRALRPGSPTADADRFLVSFIAPALVVISVQALASRAHANWAAAAFPAAVTLAAGVFALGRPRWGGAALATQAALGAAFLAAVILPPVADAFGAAKPLRRSRAWEVTAATLADHAARTGPYAAILVDHRLTYNDLVYYWRDGAPNAPLRMWVLRDAPGNHAEATAPMRADLGARVLIVSAQPRYEAMIARDFAKNGPITRLVIPVGGGRTRDLALWEASGFTPAARDAAFLARLDGRGPDDD